MEHKQLWACLWEIATKRSKGRAFLLRNKSIKLWQEWLIKHNHSKYVDYKQVSTLQIISNKEAPLNIDGEIYGSSAVEIKISEKKLFICSD